MFKELIKGLLQKLSCKHDWELIETTRVFDEFSGNLPAYRKHLYVCKKCGKFKKIKM